MKPDVRNRRSVAFSLTELLVVVLIAGILIGFLVPGIIEGRRKAQRIHCVSNLKQVGMSFRVWSGDHTSHFPMSLTTNLGGTKEFIATNETFRHFQVMSNELNTPISLACPADRQRGPARDWAALDNRNVSYFVGLDADATMPQMLLSGDRNLFGGTGQTNGILMLWTNGPARWRKAIHGECGNLGMADGSVQQVSATRLQYIVANTGVAANRLAIP
jgi:type II secretory pathway pseudopilin PulG